MSTFTLFVYILVLVFNNNVCVTRTALRTDELRGDMDTYQPL